tara:strand:- start:1467 stop:1673 length:207 start_codon:yes stop_codon:yes gene_type:complete
VTESSGHIDITVCKRNKNDEFSFGIRTGGKSDTAKPGTEYNSLDKVDEMRAEDQEKTFQIEIIDNHDW